MDLDFSRNNSEGIGSLVFTSKLTSCFGIGVILPEPTCRVVEYSEGSARGLLQSHCGPGQFDSGDHGHRRPTHGLVVGFDLCRRTARYQAFAGKPLCYLFSCKQKGVNLGPVHFMANWPAKGSSLMCKWPSILRYEDGIREMALLGTGLYMEAKLKLSNFGAFSSKGVVLAGSWPGLVWLQYLNDKVGPLVKHRPLLKLTKTDAIGKWRTSLYLAGSGKAGLGFGLKVWDRFSVPTLRLPRL